MIAIFGEKMAFFLKTNPTIQIFSKTNQYLVIFLKFKKPSQI
jgi:hypothetical protein